MEELASSHPSRRLKYMSLGMPPKDECSQLKSETFGLPSPSFPILERIQKFNKTKCLNDLCLRQKIRKHENFSLSKFSLCFLTVKFLNRNILFKLFHLQCYSPAFSGPFVFQHSISFFS